MHPLMKCVVAILCLLPVLNGCADGGRGGSTGFDVSSENAAIRTALERGECVGYESLKICPAEARASANTPTAQPRVNTDLATATSVDCFLGASGGLCTYVVRFVAQGFAAGTTFQVLFQADDDPWVLGPDPTVGGADPTSFRVPLVLSARGGYRPTQVQFAILAFEGAPPLSIEFGQLHQTEATYAFMTQELAVNYLSPSTPSSTPTPTPTGTSIATNTPGPTDCCQCESSCAAPVGGSCGTCTVVFGAVCSEDGLCAVPTPTPTATTSHTPTPCMDCPHVSVYVPIGGFVDVIDTATNWVATSVRIDGDPSGIAASPTNTVLWVGSKSSRFLSVVDTGTNTAVQGAQIDRRPYAIAFTPDGATAYVTDLGLNSISIVDVGTANVMASFAVGNQPAAIAATPDGAFVYVVNTCGNGPCFPISRGTVSIIDTHSTSITKTLALGYRSNGIAMSPSGRFALVANQCGEDPKCAAEGTLSVIDLETQEVVDDIHISGQFTSNSVAITPDSRFAYVSNTCGSSPGDCSDSYGDGSVSVVDLLTNSVVGPAIPVAGQPAGIAITPDGRTAYVAAQASGNVVAIDTATNSMAATIWVDLHPAFLAIAIVPTPSPVPTRTPPLPTATPQPTAFSGVVGTGTADSCTDAALTAALVRGGLVTFDCGGPATIQRSGTTTIATDTTIDGGNLVTIDGGNTNLVFQVAPGAKVTVQNLVLSHARGAIANEGTLTVTNSTFTANSGSGGAIYNHGGGTVTVTNSTFSDNSGGAINNEGTDGIATVMNTTFSNNSAPGGAVGGAISNSGGTLSVTNSTFTGSSARAACSQHGRFVPPSCGGGSGGAISNSGTLSVTNSTFAGNSATRSCLNRVCGGGLGGAIYNAGPAGMTVLNSTFVDNTASDAGAAIGNATTCGTSGTDPCSATLANTIVASNSSGDNCAGPIADGGHNLDDGTTCGFSSANGSLSNTDPQLDPSGLQNNGGPTQTIALEAGSPAINAGDNAICAAAPVNHLDQRGFTRPGAGHANCSIGAYEFDGMLSASARVQR